MSAPSPAGAMPLARTLSQERTNCSQPNCPKKIRESELEMRICKCAKPYCPEHSYPRDHGCPFDYLKLQQEVLRYKMQSPTNHHNQGREGPSPGDVY